MGNLTRKFRFRTCAVVAAAFVVVIALVAARPHESAAQEKGAGLSRPPGPALLMPVLDSSKGRKLFASRGCVLCHSVNGVGGRTGPSLDVSETAPLVSPFTFAARMWRGAEAMIALQDEDLGYQIDVDGEELGHISAFAYDIEEQKKFSIRDVPSAIIRLMKARDL